MSSKRKLPSKKQQQTSRRIQSGNILVSSFFKKNSGNDSISLGQNRREALNIEFPPPSDNKVTTLMTVVAEVYDAEDRSPQAKRMRQDPIISSTTSDDSDNAGLLKVPPSPKWIIHLLLTILLR